MNIKRIINKIKSFLSEPANIILVIFLLELSFATIFPIVSMIIESFTVHLNEVQFGYGTIGSFTIRGWKELLFTSDYGYSKKYFYTPLLNSLSIALIASIVAIFIGGVFAWFVSRTNVKYKKIISTLLIFPYIMPSWTIALFWNNFFANVEALGCSSNGILASLFGINVPTLVVYGMFPIGMTLGIHYAPFAYILIGGILKNMDANLEEAATILKSSRLKTLTRITLPIVAPAILNTFLLVFASSISAYAVPVFLGTPVEFRTLTTSLTYLNQVRPTQAYAIGFTLIILGLVILRINSKITGKRKAYITVTGKSSQVSYYDLKIGKYIFGIIGCILVLTISILPLITFAMESLKVDIKGGYELSNLSFAFWLGDKNNVILQNKYYNWEGGILTNPTIWTSLGHSLLLSVVCAVIAGTSGLLLGYGIVKKRNKKLSKLANIFSFIPYLIPSMAFSMAYLALSVKWSFLFGSFFLLVLVGTIKYMPFATKSSTGAMMQLSNEIEEAAILTGTSWRRRMLKIIFPIQKSNFLSSYLLPFTSCMRELTLFVLLVVNSNFLITTLLMYYNEKGFVQYGNAVNLLIVITVLIINGVVNKLTGASIDKGVGGN